MNRTSVFPTFREHTHTLCVNDIASFSSKTICDCESLSTAWINNSSLEKQHPGLKVSNEKEERVVGVEIHFSLHYCTPGDHSNARGGRCNCTLLINFNHRLLNHLRTADKF